MVYDRAESYYWVNNERVPLQREPGVFAVRFGTSRTPLSPEAQAILSQRSQPVLFIDHKGIKVYRTDEQERAVRTLNREEAIEFATPAFRRAPGSPELMLVTNQFVAQFRPEVTREQVDAINARYNVRIVEALDYADNAYLLEAPPGEEGLGAVEVANQYKEQEPTVWAHPVTVKRQATRSTISVRSPYEAQVAAERAAVAERAGVFLPQQWHLQSEHSKVTDAWDIPGLANPQGSPDIAIAILDDGLDVAHPEFQGKVVAQFDFASNTADGSPKSSQDKHGTACGGVATAAGVKAHGAAPGCSLMAVRTPNFLGSDDEARMFKWAADNGADVISCSWGPPDGTGARDPLPDNVRAAIRYCVERGRGGKGIPIFWAAGNGDESVSLDGYAANPDVIAVAACTDQGTKSWYSDFGPEIWVCAPSSGDRGLGERSIFTVDRRGSAGYNAGNAAQGDPIGDYTNDFGGTSSATPLVAGIAALMLSANPDLRENPTSQEVREVLAQTADKIGTGYDSSGHSHQFGFGRVNALRAVEEARARGQGGGGGGAGTTMRLAITAPPTHPRSGGPPTFTVTVDPNRFYAVEVATRAELFDFDNHSQERVYYGPGVSDFNFYGSWDTLPLRRGSQATFTLPQDVWDGLKQADSLAYRLWVTDVANPQGDWPNAETTTDDSVAGTAPSIQLTGGSNTAVRTVTYPSGARFDAVSPSEVDDGVDYSDPSAADGSVPLIRVEGRLTERLSPNFQVQEFARTRTQGGQVRTFRYARISPDLVERLQRLRNRLGRPLIINSGYRYPELNQAVGGAARSRHQAGQAVDIRSEGVSALRLAELALEEMGCDIGIGLGQHSIHVDVRGTLASWAYEGAEMSESEFDAWVQQQCAGRTARDVSHARVPAEAAPMIVGPDTYDRTSDDPPTFHVQPEAGRGYRVEVATRPEILGTRHRDAFNSAQLGPLPEGQATTVFTLPGPVWQHMRGAERLYYRLTPEPGVGYVQQAKWIELTDGRARIPATLARRLPTRAMAAEMDEALWRGTGGA